MCFVCFVFLKILQCRHDQFNLLQRGTPWNDGAEGVTQCPVLPGETFKYQFKVDRVSTRLIP